MRRIAKIPVFALSIAALGAGCAGTAPSAEVRPPEPEPVTAEPEPPPPAPEEPEAPPPAPALRLGNTVLPAEYRAELTIDTAKEQIAGVIDIDVNILERIDHVWLHASKLEIRNATLVARGQSWPLTRLPTSNDDFLGLSLGMTFPPGKATLHLEYTGAIAAGEMSGIFKQRTGEHEYVFTQFEATSARNVFPCFDEPRFKVPWQLTLHVPEGDLAASNAPLVAEAAGPRAGLKTFRFAPTKPLPSYLVALAVGPFDIVDLGTIGRNKTPARILVPRGRIAETRHSVEIMPQLLDQLENYFDMGYPYEKLDSVALPHFFGAMENPGLVTYDAGLLLAQPAQETLWFKRRSAGIMAHELAHQWFGNLVTLDWWDDIWLNESFATWMANKVVAAWRPEWHVEVRGIAQAGDAIEADSLVSARSVRQPIVTDDDIHRAFDAISYQKGSAVLSMFERWLGEDRFRDGVRRYVREFAWSTATSDDFFGVLSQAGEPRLRDAFQTFLNQPGVPLLSVTLACERGQTPRLALSQARLLPLGSKGTSEAGWSIPVCIKHGKGTAVAEQCTLVTERTVTLALDSARECPDWVMANAGARGYYRVAYDRAMLQKILASSARSLSVAERLGVIGDIDTLVATGKLALGESLALVPTLLKDRDPTVTNAVADMIAGIEPDLVPDKLQPNFRRFVRKHFGAKARTLGWNPGKADSDETRMLRTTLLLLAIKHGEDPMLISQAVQKATTWLSSRQGIDADLLSMVLGTAARYGSKDVYERIAAAWEKTHEPTERRMLTAAVASTTDPARIHKHLDLFTSGAIGLQDAGPFLQVPLGSPKTRHVLYDYIKANYDQLVARLPRFGASFMIRSAVRFCDDAHYQDAQAFFGPRAEAVPGGAAALRQSLEEVELCIAYRAQHQASVEQFLQTQ